jgi:sulfur-oxidizing protein SoxY
MQTRREMIRRSAGVATLLGGLGLLPTAAQANYAQGQDHGRPGQGAGR